MYHLQVTGTLNSDLVFRITMSGAYLLYIEGRNPKFDVWMQLWMAECHIPFWGHFYLDL